MGIFSGGEPKIPEGQTHATKGKDKLSNWSSRRIQKELDRIEAAKEFNAGVGKTYNDAKSKVEGAYGRNQGRGSVGQATGPYTGFSTMQAQPRSAIGGFGGDNIASYRAQHDTRLTERDGQNSQMLGFSRTQSRGDSDGIPGLPSRSEGVGSLSSHNPYSGGSQRGAEDLDEMSGLWKDYDAAKGDYDTGMAALNGMGGSGLAANSEGDAWWTARLNSALGTVRNKKSAFNNQSNPQRRVDPSVVDARRKNKADGVQRRTARGGGGAPVQGPLNTTNPDEGVL